MENVQIDWLTVFIAAILNMFIGFVWYSKWLFGHTWERIHKQKMDGSANKWAVVYGFVVSLIIAYFIAFFEAYLGVTTVTDGMFVGLCLWLGFVATTQISSVIWSGRSFEGFLLDTGYKLLSFLVMSGVIGA